MDIEKIVADLSDGYSGGGGAHHFGIEGVPFPSNERLAEIVNICRGLLFPGYYGMSILDEGSLRYHIGVDLKRLYDKLAKQITAGLAFTLSDESGVADGGVSREAKNAPAVWVEEGRRRAQAFVESLPSLRRLLQTDVRAHFRNDPAAHNEGEVILCYPGLKAISSYRIAHRLVELGTPLIPRMISELAHSETGIDINPEARIGRSFAIDHGTGVVIGETCILGDNVTIYQGVTLGAKNFPQNEDGSLVKGIPRHPILGDNVIVYANATILGRVKIGSGSVIGGNIWLTHDVEPGTKLLTSS